MPAHPSRGRAKRERVLNSIEFCTGHPSLLCPQCGGKMRIIAFLTDYVVVDRIINHLKLTFVAERPHPPHLAYQEFLVAAEPSAEHFS